MVRSYDSHQNPILRLSCTVNETNRRLNDIVPSPIVIKFYCLQIFLE